MLTFTVAAESTVEFTPSSLLAETEAHHRNAACLQAEAYDHLDMAHRILPAVPADFRTPGGASAADVVRMMETDYAGVAAAAESARRAVIAAERADTVQHAAWAEHDARNAARAARFDTDTLARFLRYLTD